MGQVPIHFVPAAKFSEGHPFPLIAIVHHRMVGTLASTDATFSHGSRDASTNFGVGLCSRHGGTNRPCIHQYVALGDQAWGNGNNRYPTDGPMHGALVDSGWNDRYPHRFVNSRTISIEHHDNGGKGSPNRGIVPEEVILASIWLDSQLLSGDEAALVALGIRFRAGKRTAICRELRAINPGRHTIVDHHYVAGRLKPHCWRPWKEDKQGFPQQRYLDALRSQTRPDVPDDHQDDHRGGGDTNPADGTQGHTTVSEGLEEEVMRTFTLPAMPTLAKVRSNAWLYDNSALEPSPRNIHVNPGREMPLIGIARSGARIVGYVNSQGVPSAKAYWIEADDILSTRPG
jgi:hypothetical protein